MLFWPFFKGTNLYKSHRKPTRFFLIKLSWWKQYQLELKEQRECKMKWHLPVPRLLWVGRKLRDPLCTQLQTKAIFYGIKRVAHNHTQEAILGPNQGIGKIYQHLSSGIQNCCTPMIAVYIPFSPSLNGSVYIN